MNKTFKVAGMHCKSCEMLIEDSLSELEGVNSYKADEKKGTVTVEFDSNEISEDQIKNIIIKEGYTIK